MSSSRFLTAFLTVMVTIAGFYVFYATFGGVFDEMGVKFAQILPTMNLPEAWFNLGLKVLGMWKYVYSSVVIIVIAMGVWLFRVAVLEQGFERQY